MKRILQVFIIFSFFLLLIAGTFNAGAQNRSNGTDQEMKEPKKTYKPGEAWTLSGPLGSHVPSTIDTLLYGYPRSFAQTINSDAWASTGSFAAEGINMIFFDRTPRSQFLFEDALDFWIPTFRKEKFYNVYIPMTLLTYNFGGNRDNHTDRLKGVFAGNVNRKIGAGANVDYLYTKGAYANQAAKNLTFGAQAYYEGDRYEMQTYLEHYNSQNQENGGITDDLYILDPAILQGGVDKIEPKSIPTRLSRATSRVIGAEFYMSHAYKLGYWKDTTQPGDTVQSEVFVPHTKFIYSFDYKYNHHIFTNSNAEEGHEFWPDTYFNYSSTNDETFYTALTNTVGIQMIEGFRTWAKFGIMAYASYEFDRFRTIVDTEENYTELDVLTPRPNDAIPYECKARNRFVIGGRIEKQRGSLLRYAADVRFGVLGDGAGELRINGNLQTRIKLGKDTVIVAAEGFFHNSPQSWLLQNYVSNHFIWHNDFGMTRSFRVGGLLHIPWTKTDIRAGGENVQNYVFFNANSLPEQYGGSVQIFSASLEQKLKFGIWNWNNSLHYQVSSNQDVIPLPAFSLYSNMFLDFTCFKVLRLMIGIDCDYYTKYRGLAYQPATMQFHVQGESPVWVGNFAVANAYISGKIKKTRFFIQWSHVNQNLFSRNYFSLPGYPVDPRQLRFGVSVDFAN